jgi:hypothetical protein
LTAALPHGVTLTAVCGGVTLSAHAFVRTNR